MFGTCLNPCRISAAVTESQAINAWSESGSPETARRVGLLYFEQEALYEKGCQSAKPTTEIVSTVLDAMSSSRERGADRRAWAILERVPQYGIDATADMYTSVIRSLARSRDRSSAERAEGVLKDAIKEFPPGLDENGHPTGMTVDSFNVILTAWVSLLTMIFMCPIEGQGCEAQTLLPSHEYSIVLTSQSTITCRQRAEEMMDQSEQKNF